MELDGLNGLPRADFDFDFDDTEGGDLNGELIGVAFSSLENNRVP